MTTLMSYPAPALQNEALIPGDKSISHRAVIFSSLAEGTSTINGFLNGEDCLATLEACRQLGVVCESPSAGKLIVHGVGKYGLKPASGVIDCGNSGTTMRLLAGVLAAQSFDSYLTGDKSLLSRPMERIARPLKFMGAELITHEGKPPLDIRGGKHLKGIEYEMPIASAQVKSSILIAGMYAQGETVVIEKGVTRDHTERMLTAFSYPVHKAGKTIRIYADHVLKATDIFVPGDPSSAAFLIVSACLVPGSDIIIRNVGINPTRTGVIDILQMMGAHITIINKRLCGEEPVADLRVQYSQLEGIDIPQALVPIAIDEFPVLFVAASVAKGQTILHGAEELRFKESDRLAAMIEGLQTLKIEAQAFQDGLFIKGGRLQGGEVESFGDHRVAMAFAVAGAAAEGPVKIKNCTNIKTSFPDFIATTCKIGMDIREISDEE